jgi:RimJ/RimL family protein N-acetyltransferase
MDVASLLPLTTARLSLRLFTPGDADDLYAYQSLPSVARYLYRPVHTRERSEQAASEARGADGMGYRRGQAGARCLPTR